VIKFVSDLRQIGGFSPGPPVSSNNKTDRYDITEILLKVVFNTIKQTKQTFSSAGITLAYNTISYPGSNPIGTIAFFGDRICSTVIMIKGFGTRLLKG
jgi:hypothetical protein